MSKRKMLFIPILLLVVGLVGISGALVQEASGQGVEPPVGTPQSDLPSSSVAAGMAQAVKVNPDELSLVSRPLPQARGTPGVPVAGMAQAVKVNPDELSLVSRPLPQARGTPGVPVAGPACLAAAIPQETLLATQSPPLTCFESLEQAKAAVPADLTIILGILYQHSHGGGNSLVIYGANCNNQGVPDLRDYNFNDITSSLDNSCPTVTLYFDINYGAPEQSYSNGRTDYVGDGMNDQASSVKFKP